MLQHKYATKIYYQIKHMKLKTLADKMLYHRAKRTVLREKWITYKLPTNIYVGIKPLQETTCLTFKVEKVHVDKKPLRAND